MKRSTLALSISLALASSPATADVRADDTLRHLHELEKLVVQALPFGRSSLETAHPIQVLAGERLDDRRGLTLGETLQNEPGIHSTFYGQGSGRPIIRGLSGPRVRILEDGLSTADTAAQSDDHAVTVDPMLVDRIEILRGPATLLYGSGASGGVVNVIDNRIPEQVPSTPFEGRYEVRGDTVADERSGALKLGGGGGNFAWHLDGSWRDADDYEIPAPARREFGHDDDHGHDNDHDHEEFDGTLENSFVEVLSGTFGASWIGERGFVGASYRRFETEYGIPAPHSHGGHDHDHDSGHDSDHGHDSGHDDDDEFAFVDMEQNIWNLKAGLNDPLPGFTRATLRLGYNDYTHREIELEDHGHDNDHDSDHDSDHGHDDGHDDGHESTQFDVETWQARLEMETAPLAGWEGALGLQFDHEDFVATGAEAFVAPNETGSLALFGLQEQTFGDLTLTVGGRIERSNIEVDRHDNDHDHDHGHGHGHGMLAFGGMDGSDDHGHDDDHDDHDNDHDHGDDHGDNHGDDHDDHHGHEPDFDIEERTFTSWSASVGAIYRITDKWQTSVNYSRAQRAPSATELFANGAHLATFSFEVGDPSLGKETTNALDWTIHRHSENLDVELNLFHKDVSNFIFLEDTGDTRGGFPLRRTRQDNAEIYGFEAQAAWQIHDTGLGDFDLRAGYDLVRAELGDGHNLPRISPQRLTTGLDWHNGSWRAGAEWQRVRRQGRVAEAETPTPGYNLINAQVAYSFDLAQGRAPMEVFLQGRNLGDNEARVHTSFLREFAPLPGRNFRLGLRGSF